jgi:hypothetical protein
LFVVTTVTTTGVSTAGRSVMLPSGNLTPRYGMSRIGEGSVSGPAPKQPGKRIRRATKQLGVVSAAGKPPRMPRGLCEQAQTAWTSYWGDAVSGIMRPPDSSVALRWIANVDRYCRLIAEADREPVVAGSTGQEKANPLYALALSFEKSIREDEQQLGIGALSRLKLGAQLAENARSLAELNAEVAADHDEQDDPRAAIIALADRRSGTDIAPPTD